MNFYTVSPVSGQDCPEKSSFVGFKQGECRFFDKKCRMKALTQ